MNSNSRGPVDAGPFTQFRRDHVRVLRAIDDLERRMPNGARLPDGTALRRVLGFIEVQFSTHMSAEDSVLYPAILAAFPAGRSTLDALAAEHVDLRLMLTTLSAGLDTPASAERDEQIQVVLRDFVDLLRLHIHREESAVFDVASRILSNLETEELARRIAPLVDLNPPGYGDPGPTKGTRS